MAGTRTSRARLLLALVPGAFLLGCGGASRPNVLIVVVDTLRADHLGAYGAPRGRTPFLDRLARRATVFERAFAASSWTAPSVASLFTSRYASQHHVTTYDARLPAAERTLAETFADAGYRTIGVTANFRLSTVLGFAQGFDTWDDRWSAPKTRANAVRRHALSALDRAAPSQPVLLYLQYMEPHPPYTPPPAYRERYERHPEVGPDANARLLAGEHDFSPAAIDHLHSLYEGEVAYLDHELARLFAGLGRRGFLDHAVVVITADHGEEFREHGLMGHGRSLYNAALRVPLLLAGGGIPAGRVVDDAVSLVDLAPTLATLARLPAAATWEGRSLVPLLAAGGAPVDVIAELLPDGGRDLRRHHAAIVRGRLKLLLMTQPWAAALGNDVEAYDLDTDMPEAAPTAVFLGMPAEAATLPALRDALRTTIGRLNTRAAPAPERQPVDEETQRRLRALGYVH